MYPHFFRHNFQPIIQRKQRRAHLLCALHKISIISIYVLCMRYFQRTFK